MDEVKIVKFFKITYPTFTFPFNGIHLKGTCILRFRGFVAVDIKRSKPPKDVCRIGISYIKSTKKNGTTPVKEMQAESHKIF